MYTTQNPASEDMPLDEFLATQPYVDLTERYREQYSDFVEKHPYVRHGADLPGGYVVSFIPEDQVEDVKKTLGADFIDAFSSIYGLLDRVNLDAAGIMQVQQQPYLNLRGQGVLVGLVDTGIDYTHPAFRYEDGRSKIQYIWDQTLIGSKPAGYPYGAEFSVEQINQALQSEDPFTVVPHQDTNGHGTFLASLAAGRENNEYMGAAPDAEIVAVKLKKAQPYYYRRFLIPPEHENAFSSTDVMMGIKYLYEKSLQLNRPMAICFALGTNFGSHASYGIVEEYMAHMAGITGLCICLAAGNESAAGHHTSGLAPGAGQSSDIGVQVGANVPSWSVYLWNDITERFSVSIVSPGKEIINRVPAKSGSVYTHHLVLEDCTVEIEYFFPLSESGRQLTFIKAIHPSPGIWTISIYGEIVLLGEYHAWMPLTGFISPEVRFTAPTPEYTVVTPATASRVIAIGAYYSQNNSLMAESSWGPSTASEMIPDFVAPGVEVGGAYPNAHGTMSGTSVAAAISAGACALLLQWGIVNGNDPALNGHRIRALLIRGCAKNPLIQYPNIQWGYGRLNLMQSIRLIQGN